MAGFSDSLDTEKTAVNSDGGIFGLLDTEKTAVNSDGGIFGLPWHRKTRGQFRWRDFRTPLTPKKTRSIKMAGFSDSLDTEKTAVD